MYNEILNDGKLSQALTQANISVLLKKDKNPLDCASYRPISLLCCEYMILNKSLATRLNEVISTIIHRDQTGFIPGWQSFFNSKRLLNTLYSEHSVQLPEVICHLMPKRHLIGLNGNICMQFYRSMDLERCFAIGLGFPIYIWMP